MKEGESMEKILKSFLKQGICFIILLSLMMTIFPEVLLQTFNIKSDVKAATTLSNPRIEEDGSMDAGQKVTWDCVWFGSYPQTEIVDEPNTCGTYGKEWGNQTDYIVNASIYNLLENSSNWDSNEDIKINGKKYHRIMKCNATFGTSGSNQYYNWSDTTSYHYFRYEPIKWRVLNVSNKETLLLADKALDVQKYNTEDTYITWENSTIRSWLNGYGPSSNKQEIDFFHNNFINIAFNEEEQEAIINTNIENSNNLSYGIDGGNDTSDKIFLLSESEVYNTQSAKSYGFVPNNNTYDNARRCASSTYAKAMGTYIDNVNSAGFGKCWWWLRSPGYHSNNAVEVFYYGCVDNTGVSVNRSDFGIRPAINLNINYTDFWSYAGTVCSDETKSEVTKITGKELIHYTSGYGGSTDEVLNDEVVRDAFQELVTAIDEYMTTLNSSVKTENSTENHVKNLKDYDQGSENHILTGVCDNENVWTAAYTGLAEFYDRFEENPPDQSFDKIDISASLNSIEAQITNTIRYSFKTYNFKSSTTDYNVKVNITTAFDAFTGEIEVTRKKQIGGSTNLWTFVIVSDVDSNVKTMAKYYKELCDTLEQVVKDGFKEYLLTVGKVSCITNITKKEFVGIIDKIADYMKEKGYGNIAKYSAFLYDGYEISKNVSSLTSKRLLSEKLAGANDLYDKVNTLDYSDNSVKDKLTNAALKKVQEKKEILCDILYNYIYHPDEDLMTERNFLDKIWDKIISWKEKGKKVTVQCPVSIEVYDKNNNLLGIAEDGYSECTDDIYIDVDGDVKTIYIPDGQEVVIKMTGTDTGKMTYSIESFEQNVPVGRLNYYNVPLENNSVYTQTISSGNVSDDLEAYPLENEAGTLITPDEYISVNDKALCIIECEESEGGAVFGQGAYAKGDNVILYAYEKEGYQFEGWYNGDYLLETNNIYRMTALEDTTIQAIFSPIPKEQIIICKDSFEKDLSDSVFNVNASASGNGKIHYFSENENIATVDSNGNVTIHDIGEVKLIVSAEPTDDYTNALKRIILIVSDKGIIDSSSTDTSQKANTSAGRGTSDALISEIKIESELANRIAAGKKTKLTALVFPANATKNSIIWSSSNPEIATVTQNGVVSVKKKTGGKSVTITATAADGSGVSASWKIKSMKGVVKKIAITGVKTVKAGKSLKLKVKVTAIKGANKKLKWTSSNTKYATVTSSGKVKTFKAGKGKKVKITAMATDGSNKKKTVTIKIK